MTPRLPSLLFRAVSGYVVRLSEVLPLLAASDTKQLDVVALHTLVVDEDLTLQGSADQASLLTLVAPQVCSVTCTALVRCRMKSGGPNQYAPFVILRLLALATMAHLHWACEHADVSHIL